LAYVRATKQNTAVYIMDLPTKKQRMLVANDPDIKEQELFASSTETAVKKLPFLKRFFAKKEPPVPALYAVVPSPDGFRYLYLSKNGNITSFWTILPDGSKRIRIYQTKGVAEQVTWMNDGHKIFFQERQKQYGFLMAHYNIKMLDADLARIVDLIPPQMSNRAPAVSPDGVKVAFTGRSGLWYPSGGHVGIWVAVLR
jgi:hypothetical protein